MPLCLYTSNQLETLADQLASVLAVPVASPLAPEVVVVQSQGMARWLKLELAKRHGVCANVRFPFPNAFAHEIFRAVLPDLPVESAFTRGAMTWRILDTLPALLERPGFEAPRQYLADRSESRRAYQLAARIAYLFDQYLIFRPELMVGWDEGADDHWQAILWREATAGLPRQHPAALRREFAARFPNEPLAAAALPARCAVFGISALPPFHVELLAALGDRVAVHFFLLQPSQEFWGDIVSAREVDRILRRASTNTSAADWHLEEGHPLLASLGKLGREFLNLVLDAADWPHLEAFVDPITESSSLLRTLQSDLLYLRNRDRDPAWPPVLGEPDDDSLQIHSCHSPLRELEVLQDHLLDWFERDPQLSPRDVLVMMPDIETYAPFIQAVFDAPEDEAQRIPYRIADRSPRRRGQLADTLLELLELPQSRLGAPTVLALLEAPAVRNRFKLAEPDLELIRHWVEQTRIRWGWDAQHRAGFDLPPFNQNTWRAGLDQLLLGYAMRGHGDHLFADILPYDDLEGESAVVLGHFAEFLQCLFQTLEALREPRTPLAWGEFLQRLVTDWFAPTPEAETELRVIRQSLTQLVQQARLGGAQTAVDCAVLHEHLSAALVEDTFGAGFLSGGVTFCALKPMRSIPFPVICLLGLNDDAFPRASAKLGFDLMAQHPRLGDRSSREDDRYLFLETLLSARRRLYLSYVGQSIRDNRPRPPSVLVSELMDHLRRSVAFRGDSGQPAAEGTEGTDPLENRVWFRERLQAFSEAYFQADGPLFSFSQDNCQASRERRAARVEQGPFIMTPLAEPEAEWRTVDVGALAKFFANPTSFLLTRRLGLRLPDRAVALEEREPFTVEGLDRYQLATDVLEGMLAHQPTSQTAAVLRASGRLPFGVPGEAGLRELSQRAAEFGQRLERFHPEQVLDPVTVDLAVGEFHLTGQLRQLTPSGLLAYRCAQIKAKDTLRLWIEHLVWNALAADQSPRRSYLAGYGKDNSFDLREYQPVVQAREHLRDLLVLYAQGLTRPLRFFPETSRAFVEAADPVGGKKAGSNATALQRWEGSEYLGRKGERDDPSYRLCFDRAAPFDAEFEKTARLVFGPLLEHEAPLED